MADEEQGATRSASNPKNALTHKYFGGKVPGWAIVGGTVAAFVAYRKLKGGGSSSAAPVPAGTTDTSLGAQTPGTLDSGGGGGGGGQQAGAGFYTDPNTALIEQELQQLLSMQPSSQQQQANPNDNVSPQQPNAPQQTDVYGNPLSGGPIYAYSGGQLIGYAPHATSAFSTRAPAASGYEALGVAPSSPITLLPTQLGPANTGPAAKIPTAGTVTPV